MNETAESLALNIAASLLYEVGKAGLHAIRLKFGSNQTLFEKQFKAALTAAVSDLTLQIGHEPVKTFFMCEPVKRFLIEYLEGKSPEIAELDKSLRLHLGRDWLVFRELARAGLTLGQVITNFLHRLDYEALKEGGTAPVVLARKMEELKDGRTGEYLDLVSHVAQDTEVDLHANWLRLREGHRSEVVSWVLRMRSTISTWSVLPSDLRARTLRLGAFAELQRSDGLQRANELAAEANSLTKTPEGIRLEARIALIEKGARSALEILSSMDDVDSLNLKAAIHLEIDELSEGLAVIEVITRRFNPTPETLRLRALYHVLMRNVPQAKVAAQEALGLAPTWLSIQHTAALVDYLSVLSPAALPNNIPAYPIPLSRSLIKTGPADLQRLSSAKNRFESLAQNPDASIDERRRLQTWVLACLANHPLLQEQAINYCREILNEDPLNLYPITWVAAREWPVDLSPSMSRLNQRLMGGQAQISDCTALFTCLLARHAGEDLLDALSNSHTVFESQGLNHLWAFWSLRLWLLIDDLPEATRCLSILAGTELEPTATEALLHARAVRSHEWMPLIIYLLDKYEHSSDPVVLFRYCEVLMDMEWWADAADRASQLVDSIGTAGAVHLSATATFNDRRYAECLRLIDEHQDWFVEAKLPPYLRRLRVECKKHLGIIPQAVSDAQDLARDYPSTMNLLALAEVYYLHGDFAGLVLVSRQLVTLSDVRPEQCLRLAQLVRWNDHTLAVRFWRRAAQIPEVPDNLVGPIVLSGYELGLDTELTPFVSRLMHLGATESFGLRLASVQEAAELIRTQKQNAARLLQTYQEGQIPVHLAVQPLNLSLASVYRRALQVNEDDQSGRSYDSLFARHGGRSLSDPALKLKSNWRLNMDVTAILLASHLEILELVTTSFPVRIPSNLVPALVAMRARLAPSQPVRLKAHREVLQLIADKRIRVLSSSSTSVFADCDYTVDFVATDIDNAVSCRDLVDSLRDEGPLSADDYVQAIKALGTEGAVSKAIDPVRQGRSVLISGGLSELLSTARILSVVGDRFVSYIHEDEVRRIKNEVSEQENQGELAEWLWRILEVVRSGIAEKTLEVLPTVPVVLDEDLQSPELGCLMELLAFEPTQEDIIWVDDRCIHGYLLRDSVPIIGVMEVLHALLDLENLTRSQYYSLVNRLRASGVLFIPISSDEILHHLQSTTLQDTAVVETHQLAVLRTYVSACISRASLLHPPQDSARPGEIPFLLSLRQETVEAIAMTWRANGVPVNVRRSQADWILENLYTEQHALLQESNPNLQVNKLFLSGLGLTSLLTAGFPMDSAGGPGSLRREYLDWLYERLLRHRIAADPHIVWVIGDQLKRLLTSEDTTIPDSFPKEHFLAARLVISQRFFDDLPSAIKNVLGRDREFMRAIGIEQVPTMNLAGREFEHSALVPSLYEAIHGRVSTALAFDGTSARVEPHPSQDNAVRIVLDSGQWIDLIDDILELLLDDPTATESFLHRKRSWFDCPSEQFRQLSLTLITDSNYTDRMAEVEGWRSGSVLGFYEDIKRTLHRRSAFSLNSLQFPTPEKLAWFLRIPPDSTSSAWLQEHFGHAVKTLLAEEGISSTIDRIAGIPAPLPIEVIEQLLSLNSEDRDKTVRYLLQRSTSPVYLTQVVHLLTKMPESKYKRLARRLISRMLSDHEHNWYKAFLAVLRWVDHQSTSWNLSAQTRLATVWAHAHLLLSTLVSEGVDLEWIMQAANEGKTIVSLDTFLRPAEYCYDVCHPRNVSIPGLLLSSFAYAVSQQDLVLTDTLREKVVDLACVKQGGITLPAPDLIQHAGPYRDSLQSFLAGDRGDRLRDVLGGEAAALISSSSVGALATMSVSTLEEEPSSTVAWAILHGMYSGGSPQAELIPRVASVIRTTDFLSLHNKSPECARMALITSSIHVGLTADISLREYLTDQLLRLARSIQTRSTEAGTRLEEESLMSGFAIMEAALYSTRAGDNLEANVRAFSDVMCSIVDALPVLTQHYKLAFTEFVQVLPVDVSRYAWRLLNRTRQPRS